MLAENKDFVHGDRVEPSLDPTPDCRKEGGGADNLMWLVIGMVVRPDDDFLTKILSKVSG